MNCVAHLISPYLVIKVNESVKSNITDYTNLRASERHREKKRNNLRLVYEAFLVLFYKSDENKIFFSNLVSLRITVL